MTRGAAWSLLGCIICSKQHCCWPCSCTMPLGSILTPYSIVLCICRFCGPYILFILWPEVALCSITFWWRSCSDRSSTKRWGTQWFSPPSVVCSIYFSFHDRASGCSSFSSATTTQPLNCTLVTADILYMYSLRLAPQWFTFTSLITLHYITRHNFSPTRSVTLKVFVSAPDCRDVVLEA